MDEKCPFSRLIYKHVVMDQVMGSSELASALGITRDALYGRMNSRTRFRPHEIRKLIEVFPHDDPVRFFTKNSKYVVARRPNPSGPQADLFEAAETAMVEVFDMMRLVTQALADGPKLTKSEKQRILAQVADSEQALASLRAFLEDPQK